MGHISLHCLPIWRYLFTYLFPKYFATNFPVIFLLSPWSSSQTITYNPWIRIQSYIWPLFLPGKMYDHVYFPGEDFLYPCPLGMSFKWAVVLQLCTTCGTGTMCRMICNLAPSLLFLCHLITWDTPWSHGYILVERKQHKRSRNPRHLSNFFM